MAFTQLLAEHGIMDDGAFTEQVLRSDSFHLWYLEKKAAEYSMEVTLLPCFRDVNAVNLENRELYREHLRILMPDYKLSLEEWLRDVLSKRTPQDVLLCLVVHTHHFLVYYSASENTVSVADACHKWKLQQNYALVDQFVMPVCRALTTVWKLDTIPSVFTEFGFVRESNVDCAQASLIQRVKLIEAKGAMPRSHITADNIAEYSEMLATSPEFFAYVAYYLGTRTTER